MADRWRPGDLIVRREVLGLAPIVEPRAEPPWCGRPWLALPVYVVEDSDDALVTYIATGAEIGHYDGAWPTPDGLHPWSGRTRWTGHGTLMVQRPGEHHALWHFWLGPDRTFATWYVNLQTAFRRTTSGYDTQDLELDILVAPDGSWTFKDREVLPDRVAEGRYSAALVDWVVDLGDGLGARLDAGDRWWDERWVDWRPDPTWADPALPEGWSDAR